MPFNTPVHPREHTIDANTASSAFARLAPVYEALPRAALTSVNIDPAAVVAASLAAARGLAPLAAALAPLFPNDPTPLATLETHAYATLYAHRRCARPLVSPEARTIMTDAQRLHAQLRAIVSVLAAWEHIGKSAAHDLGRARSGRGIAVDLMAMARVLRANLAAVESLSALRASDFDRAERLSSALLESIGQRQLQCTTERKSARLDRRRAFTLLVQQYERVRKAVEFVRAAEGDAERWVPGLRRGRTRRVGAAASRSAQSSQPGSF